MPSARALNGSRPGEFFPRSPPIAERLGWATVVLGDEDTVGKVEDFREIRRDHDDADARIGQVPDDLVNLRNGANVDTSRRLVEDDKSRSRASHFASTTFC